MQFHTTFKLVHEQARESDHAATHFCNHHDDIISTQVDAFSRAQSSLDVARKHLRHPKRKTLGRIPPLWIRGIAVGGLSDGNHVSTPGPGAGHAVKIHLCNRLPDSIQELDINDEMPTAVDSKLSEATHTGLSQQVQPGLEAEISKSEFLGNMTRYPAVVHR